MNDKKGGETLNKWLHFVLLDILLNMNWIVISVKY